MSVVSLLGVKVLDNPAQFLSKYQFEITFECLEQLQKGGLVSSPHLESPPLNQCSRSGMEAHLCRLRYFVRSLKRRLTISSY